MVAGQQVDRVRREQRVRPLPGINRESIEQCIEIIINVSLYLCKFILYITYIHLSAVFV